MYDIISVLFVLVFFGLCVGYANLCDRILGPDEQATADAIAAATPDPDDQAVAA